MGAGSFLSSTIAALPSFRRRQLASSIHGEAVKEAGIDCQLADTQLLHGFHMDLAERLHHLQLAGGSCPPHLNWLVDAFSVTLSTHAGLQSALRSDSSNNRCSVHDGAGSPRAASRDERHTHEVVGLLDVCNALKHSVSDVGARLARLERALQSIEEALVQKAAVIRDSRPHMSSIPAVRQATRRLSSALQDGRFNILKSAKNPGSADNKLLTEARASLLHLIAKREAAQLKVRTYNSSSPSLTEQAADGAILTTLLVLAASFSSLTPPGQISRRRDSPILRLSKLAAGVVAGGCAKNGGTVPLWVAPLVKLHQDLAREEHSTGGAALFTQLHSLQTAAASLERSLLSGSSASSSVILQDVQRLRKNLAEVQTSTSTIRCHTASLLQGLLALRLRFLEG